MSRRLIVTAGLIVAAAAVAEARPRRSWELDNRTKSDYWDSIETLKLTNDDIPEEPYHELSARKDDEIIKAFGDTGTPSVRLSLLHHKKAMGERAEAEGTRPRRNPLLLVHGAMVQASRSFADGAYHTPGRKGLATHLAEAGYQVFAISFAHPHGDNDAQAEHIAAAIGRIKEVTSADKVDVISHSKGTIAARMYASNVRATMRKFTKYDGDIGRLILIGGPQGGLDINFAFPNLNYMIIADSFNAPVVWTRAMVNYVWTDYTVQCIVGPKSGFKGQPQMLARFDDVYGLIELDGQFDVHTTYNGGAGQVTVSPGIDKAIAEGGNLIARLEKAGVDKKIEVAMLAGSHPRVMEYLGERRGPSDGVLLVRSALHEKGVTGRGAKVIRKTALALNHLELTWHPRAVSWLLETLERE